MSIKDIDLSDLDKLDAFQLKYALDRNLITEDEYLERAEAEGDEPEDEYDNKRKFPGAKLLAIAGELGLSAEAEDYTDREALVAAIRAAEAEPTED